jgi:hypothetical protein
MGEGQAASQVFEPSLKRVIILKQSRCPGCHAPVTLQYERVNSGDTYEFHLLSPSPAHPLCEAALEDLRLNDPLRFSREIHYAQGQVPKACTVRRYKKSKGKLRGVHRAVQSKVKGNSR